MKSQALLFAILFALGGSIADADPAQRSELRTTSAFKAIDITGTIEVEARIDRTTSVEVRGDADRIKDVSTTVTNGVLVIGTKRHMKSSKHLKVIVTAPDLSALTISGTGTLVASGIANIRLEVAVPGTGQVTLSGKTTALRLAIDGTGSIKATDLVSASAAVDIAGTGEVNVHATRTLDLKVAGTAALQVHGKPAITKSVTGVMAIDER